MEAVFFENLCWGWPPAAMWRMLFTTTTVVPPFAPFSEITCPGSHASLPTIVRLLAIAPTEKCRARQKRERVAVERHATPTIYVCVWRSAVDTLYVAIVVPILQ